MSKVRHPGSGKPYVGTPASGIPARGYTWEQFKAGNTAHETHGAGSLNNPGRPSTAAGGGGMSRLAETRAGEFIEAFIGHQACPEYLRWPQFAQAVKHWGRTETQEQLVYEWMMALPEDQRYVPQSATAQKSPLELWGYVAGKAARARERLGLDPASHARIMRDLGLARKASDDAIAHLAAAGKVIRQQREAAGNGHPGIEGGGDDGSAGS